MRFCVLGQALNHTSLLMPEQCVHSRYPVADHLTPDCLRDLIGYEVRYRSPRCLQRNKHPPTGNNVECESAAGTRGSRSSGTPATKMQVPAARAVRPGDGILKPSCPSKRLCLCSQAWRLRSPSHGVQSATCSLVKCKVCGLAVCHGCHAAFNRPVLDSKNTQTKSL